MKLEFGWLGGNHRLEPRHGLRTLMIRMCLYYFYGNQIAKGIPQSIIPLLRLLQRFR